jgi:hypothetical protein
MTLTIRRIAVRFSSPMERTSVIQRLNPTIQANGSLNSSSTNAFEFFGSPFLSVLVNETQYTSSGIIAVHYDTQQGFQREFDHLAAHSGAAAAPVLLAAQGRL